MSPRARAALSTARAEPFLLAVTIPSERVGDQANSYPYALPAVRALIAPASVTFHPQVTFFVGENGSGKSTVIEAIAVAAGFNAEGGTKNFNFATRSTESDLHQAVRLIRGLRREKSGFFLRAESLYNVATEIENRAATDSYGSVSLHEQSHGEAFMALALNRFQNDGLYLLDEPESALSSNRQLALLALMHDHTARRGSQFIVATHSPILLAYPHATIYELSPAGIAPVAYEQTEHYKVTLDFLANRETYLRHLLADPE